MTSDEIIEQALALGKYRTDPEAGVVIGQRGKPLAPTTDRDGYVKVTIFLRRGLQRTVSVHRVVAMAAWGRAAIEGRQVGHRNSDTTDNRLTNLWLPSTAREHWHHDEAITPHYRGGPGLKMWLPCARCGDPDGPVQGKRSVTPSRVTGASFGIEGDLCWRCYRALHERERRRRKREGADVEATVGEPGGRRGKDHRNQEPASPG